MLRRTLLICTLLFAAGCSTFDYTIARRSTIDRDIATARAEITAQMGALSTKETGLLRQSIREHEGREQQAADYLFKGVAVFGGLKTPTRPEMVMGQSINQTATQLPAATPTAQAAAFKALQTELDEVKISNEALRAQYEVELGKARAEGEAKAKALNDLGTQLVQVDKDRVKALEEARVKEAALQTTKDQVQDAALAAKTEEAERAKEDRAIRTKLSAIVGGLALLCLAGAIWSPIWKPKFGAACALLSLVAVGIWWVQPWHLAVAVGVGVVAVALWAVRNHYIESKAATNVYRAIQRVKDTAKEDYDRVLKPQLDEWMTKYTKDGTKVPDTTLINHIDHRLMEVEEK